MDKINKTTLLKTSRSGHTKTMWHSWVKINKTKIKTNKQAHQMI